MSGLQRTALVITVIGAVNWGLIGLFQYDLVAAIFGGGDQVGGFARIIYTIVGLSGLVCLSMLFKPDEEFARNKEREARPEDI